VETGKQNAKANIIFPPIPPKLFLNSVLYYYYYFLARNFVTWRIFKKNGSGNPSKDFSGKITNKVAMFR
jgi:hypothetical protein